MSREHGVPLSYEQQRIWLQSLLAPDARTDNLFLPRRLTGPLQVEALRWAFEQMVHRHEGLRSVYRTRDGVPLQYIEPPGPWSLACEDLRGASEAARAAEVSRQLDEAPARLFDLTTGPLLRTLLLRTADEEHTLIVVMHHIASDGWSVRIFWRELWKHYEARVQGTDVALAPPRFHFADYAASQRSWLTGEVLDEKLGYWRERLAGAPSDTLLPFKAARPDEPSNHAAKITLKFDPELVARLRQVGTDSSAVMKPTLFTTLLAAFRMLLHRYTGQDDLCIGVAHANRDRRDVRNLIGCVSNTLVVRNQIDGQLTFVELLLREHDATAEAYRHADTPFEAVLEALNPERRLGRSPLFQVLFIQSVREAEQLRVGQLCVEVQWPESFAWETMFYLEVYVHQEHDGSVQVDIVYKQDLFERALVEQMARHYRLLLEAVVADGGERVDEIALLTADELRVAEAEGTGRSRAASERLVHELFVAQVERSPDRPAIKWRGGALTYRELERDTSRVAGGLAALGVGAGDVVGLCVDRSPEMLIGMLGILRAGAAYLPLDPELPRERLAAMVREARIRRALSHRGLAACLPADMSVLDLEDRGWWADGLHATRACHPDDLAYVLYTSGSTGTPKAVCVPHRSLASYAECAIEDYALSAADRVLQFAAFSWDTSCEEIFPTLASGATLVLRDPSMLDSIGSFLRACDEENLTILNLPTAYWHELVRGLPADPDAWPSTIRIVIIGGEQARSEHLASWWRKVGRRVRLVNTYGMTEATAVSTLCELVPLLEQGAVGDRVPLGLPIGGVQAHVLDASLRPVPVGVTGELHIGGLGVSRGYLHRPGLTAERFVPNPLVGRGARMYRTGDLARRRADGSLEMIGRGDHQVKVRGFRIELGEIERALEAYEGIGQGVVIARGEVGEDRQLVAYVVASRGQVEVSSLREHLQRRLPEYMVPAALVVLEAMPLTRSGKVDRKALPAPLEDAFQRSAYIAPRSPVENALAEIWQDLLGRARVGVADNFFALGGHSLVVVRLVARISTVLAVELPLRAVFDSPTIAGLAALIDDLARAEVTSEATSASTELSKLVAALPESDVTALLAEWSKVMLDVAPTRSPDELTGDRRALLDKWLAQQHIDSHPSQPLARLTSPTARVTFGQQLHWDFHQRGNFADTSILAMAFSLRGQLDVRAMQQAIAALNDRHTALRTLFSLQQDRLIQTVHARGCELEAIDLSSGQPDQRRSQARQLFEALRRGYDPRREVFRAQLVRLDDQEHLLFLAPHHIVVDGFSFNVLVADLAALYRTLAAGKEPDLSPLALQYNDFCFWQNTLEQRPIGRKQLEFWARAVAGYAGGEVPGDRRSIDRGSVGMAVDTYELGAVPFVLEDARWNAVAQLCTRLGCTPFTVLATGFFLLLTRWSGRSDVIAMSSNFHRNRPGSEAVIGNFATPYPLRVTFDENATVEEAMRGCHEAVLAHREHAHVGPTSAASTWPEWSRYNVNYALDRQDAGALDFGTVKAEPLDWDTSSPRNLNDLGLFVGQGARGIRGYLSYNPERFSPELVTVAAARLGELIETITTEPSRRVGALPRISPGRRL